jgi:pimeloyl-ACP methyl ester carboxylesterase
MIGRLRPRETGSGRPLVIQGPAWGPSSDYLRLTLAPLLQRDHRVITFDPRNVGEGPRADCDDAQATEHLVADLETLRRQLSLERFVLAGHSHGGFIAMGYAVRHGEFLDALLLFNTRLGESGRDDAAERVLQRFAADPRRREAVELFRATGGRPDGVDSNAELARQIRVLMPAYFYDLGAMRELARAARSSRAPSAEALARMPERAESWVQKGLATVDVPTLVITGRYDIATTPADARRIHSLLPRSRLEVLERSGHHPWMEEPERFTALVGDFLAAL